jgi:hypothetical protein
LRLLKVQKGSASVSLAVKWQDKIETPRRGVRRGLRGGEELLVICDWLLGKRMKKRLLRCGWIILLQAVLGAAATFFNDYFRKMISPRINANGLE